MKTDIDRLAYTTWNCKYHIVFAPKYRRKVFYGGKRNEIVKILIVMQYQIKIMKIFK